MDISRCFLIWISFIGLCLCFTYSGRIPSESVVRRKRSTSSSVFSIYLNGTIYTVNQTNQNWNTEPYEAMVVQNGKIVYLGSDNGAKNGYINKSSINVYNLHGYAVLPGIHDIHMHPLEAMSPVAGTCKLSNDEDPENMIDLIKECAPNQIGTEWVLGHGHSIIKLLEHIDRGGRDPKYILDDAVPDKPVIMLEETSHSVWVNSEALYRAGINRTTGIRPGGVITRNLTTNEPNGILLENEGLAIMDLALARSKELDKLNYDGLVYSMDNLTENGITSICDARVYWKSGHTEAWDSACNQGKLTVRAVLGLWAYPHEDDDFQISELKKMYSASSSKCFMKKSQIKLYSDGLLESTTAAMLAKYVKDLELQGLEDNVGLNYFDQNRTEKYVKALQSFDSDKGFDFNIHAIGDRGVRETLGAFENVFENGTRHRMTHLELIDAADISRFKYLNTIADFQVSGTFTLPSYIPHLETLIGGTRAANFIPVKSVKDTGATTTFSSDWDVSDLNPFIGMQHSVERGSQSVTLKDAIEMYTINSAFAMRQDEVTGSLEVGKAADFIVIDKDVFNIDSKYINSTLVLHTVLAGESMFKRWNDFPEDITSQFRPVSGSVSHTHVGDFRLILSMILLFVVCNYVTLMHRGILLLLSDIGISDIVSLNYIRIEQTTCLKHILSTPT